jgi:uncharacterized membrane protein YeiH
VEITTDPENLGSQKVILANGGVLVETSDRGAAHGHAPGLPIASNWGPDRGRRKPRPNASADARPDAAGLRRLSSPGTRPAAAAGAVREPDPMRDLPLLPLLLTVVEATATIAFALSGLLEAARKRLDAVGVCVVAGLAAFGGGTLRDVLLDRRPFFWVEHAVWLWALLALCVGAMAWLRAQHFAPTEKAMQWPDALGLGLFSASGTQLALAQGLPPIVAVLMGVVTATFGGVLRDIVCNEIPSAFRDHRPYAVCAFVGGWVLVGGRALGLPDGATVLAAAGTATGLRALALLTDYRLPQWSSDGEASDGKR